MLARIFGKQALPTANTSTQTNVPAANTNAVVSLTGVAQSASQENRRWVIHTVVWSYNTAPSAGRLTISDGVQSNFDIDITAAGPGALGFTWFASLGASVTITLFAGGVSVQGKLNVQAENES